MKVLVTGADGFIGARLVARLLRVAATLGARCSIYLLDRRFGRVPTDHGSRGRRPRRGPSPGEGVTAAAPDLVFHLASIPGGAGRAKNFELGLHVNLGPRVGCSKRAAPGRRPRFVFASRVAVYGVPMPRHRREHAGGAPMSYGAHKRRRDPDRDYSGVDSSTAVSLRLPGSSRAVAAVGFAFGVHERPDPRTSAGRPFKFPVAAGGAWWMSRQCVVDNLLQAARCRRQSIGAGTHIPASRAACNDRRDTGRRAGFDARS